MNKCWICGRREKEVKKEYEKIAKKIELLPSKKRELFEDPNKVGFLIPLDPKIKEVKICWFCYHWVKFISYASVLPKAGELLNKGFFGNLRLITRSLAEDVKEVFEK